LYLDLKTPDETAAAAFERQLRYRDAALQGMAIAADDDLPDVECRSYVGGEALFWQP